MLEVKLLAQCSEQIGRQAAPHLPAQRPEASPGTGGGRSRNPLREGAPSAEKGLPRKGRERRSMIEQTVSIERMEDAIDIFGSFDENIRIIEQELAVRVVSRDDQLKISGEEDEAVDQAAKVIQGLLSLSRPGRDHPRAKRPLSDPAGEVRQRGQDPDPGRRRPLRHRQGETRQGQKPWARSGMWMPSGTTPSPWGWAPPAPARPIWRWPPPWPPSAPRRSTASSSPARRWRRGERLGFLPGDLQSKVDPYLRPLYDALFDMLGPETYNKYLERGNIEVAPLAYMRGRTLDDSFIILDEAQNTSREQMKMFLTRMGFGSKIVITGDVTQIDLPGDKVSGLKEAMRILRDGGGHCHLPPEPGGMWSAM